MVNVCWAWSSSGRRQYTGLARRRRRHRHHLRHSPPLSLCRTGSGLGFRLCAMALVRTPPLLHQLPKPVAIVIACGFSSLSLSLFAADLGLGYWVVKEVWRQRGSGERGSRMREIESREERRDPSEPPFLFYLIFFFLYLV